LLFQILKEEDIELIVNIKIPGLEITKMQNSASGNSGKSHNHNSHNKDKGNKRKATRVQRACSNCRKRKQGCEEERPCRRCVEKGIDCVEVEPKRKRGRAKSYSQRSRERAGSRGSNEEMPDYNDEEDDVEDTFSYESEGEGEEEEGSSEEDQSSMISPRGNASNASTSPIMIPHTFKLNGSNTSGSNANSLSNSFKNIESSHSHSHHVRSRNGSLSGSSNNVKIGSVRPVSPSGTSPDSPNLGDIEVDAPKEKFVEEFMEEESISGINLSLLLPFIGNLESSNEEQASPMFIDDEYGYLLERDQMQSVGSAGQYKKSQIPNGNDSMIHQKIMNSNLPFYTSAFSSRGVPSSGVDEGDFKAQVYIKECWEEFQSRYSANEVDVELHRSTESWKELTKCLRNLDWQKAQALMKEMESNSQNGKFGEHVQPSMVFWSSGGRIHHANDSFCNLVGYSMEELRAEVSADLNSTHGYNMPFNQRDKMRAHSFFHPEEMMKILKRQLDASQHPEKSSYQMNTRLLSKHRQEIPVSCSILNLRDNLGVSLLTLAIFVA